jgi:hypothetical protein
MTVKTNSCGNTKQQGWSERELTLLRQVIDETPHRLNIARLEALLPGRSSASIRKQACLLRQREGLVVAKMAKPEPKRSRTYRRLSADDLALDDDWQAKARTSSRNLFLALQQASFA